MAGHLSGLASGLVNTAQQVGGSLGLAVLSGIAASSTARFLVHSSAQHGSAVIAAATVHGYKQGFYVAVTFSILASLLAIVVIKNKIVKADHAAPAL